MEEVEGLKRDKNVLMMELVHLRQQQQVFSSIGRQKALCSARMNASAVLVHTFGDSVQPKHSTLKDMCVAEIRYACISHEEASGAHREATIRADIVLLESGLQSCSSRSDGDSSSAKPGIPCRC